MTASLGLFCRKPKFYIFTLVLTSCLSFMDITTVAADHAVLNSPPVERAQDKNAVVIERDEDWKVTSYRISTGDCTIEWTARDVEIGVVKHESDDCRTPLALQMPLLAQIVETFLNHDPHAGSLRTLFWGRIEPDYSPGLHELSFRLALAAYQSPGWDKNRGRARNGDINGFVKDLANRAMIYPELKALFAHFHKTVYFSCAEKVLVTEAAKLPFYDQLKPFGVTAKDRLPFDCMAWFAVADAPDQEKTSTP